MKRQYRNGIFETNSSSTHTLVITTKENYEKWKTEDLYMFRDNCGWSFKNVAKPKQGEIFTREEVIKLIIADDPDYSDVDWENEDILRETFIDYDFIHSDWENDYLEGFSEFYTTPNGEEIVVFGEYGWE